MSPSSSWKPDFELQNCQTNVELALEILQTAFPTACAEVSTVNPGPERSLLSKLSHLEIAIIDDPEIARIHEEQMNDASPTDVITFHHGELLISAETAQREAQARRWPVERELLLYIVHGLLHLHGYDDLEPTNRTEMHRVQETILDRLWPLDA